jgi:tRNA-specific 2-thiouridylase
VAVGEPLFVTAIDAAKNIVIVGPREALAVSRVDFGDVNWLGGGSFAKAAGGDGVAVRARLRSSMEPVAARLFATGGKSGHIILERPEYGVSPGQACVFYLDGGAGGTGGDDEGGGGGVEGEARARAGNISEGLRVLGGGWIRGAAN